MKKLLHKFYHRVMHYFKTCPYCQYSGDDWTDSGECPNCGEVS